MLKKLLITISILFISTLQTLAADISTEKCTLCLYKDGETVKIEKDYEDDSRISGFFYAGYSTGEY